MATYYKYKERDLDKSMIDWSGLTKTISDNLMTEKNRREELKFELEQKHQEQLQKLNEYEQGLDPTANKFAMQQAQQARDFLLENHKIMKSGLRSVNDSKLIKQGVSDTWSTLSNSLKTYNANYERLSELDGKGNEAVLKAMSDQLDLSNKQIYYDPNTGSGFYVNVDVNGNIDMNSALPVRALNNIQHQEFETLDVNAEAAKVASNAAQWKNFLTSTSDISDARINPNYQDWINNTAKSALNTNEKTASVLMDYLGIEYNLDGTPSKRTVTYQRVKGYDENGVMEMEEVTVDIGDVEMEFNPKSGKLEPKLTDEQRRLAEDAYKNAIEINIAREASKDYVAPRDSDRRAANVKKDKEAKYNLILAALQGEENKFRSLFDPAESAVAEIVGGQLIMNGKDPIDVSSSDTISDAGARMAQQMGLSGEDFVDYLRKKGLSNALVSDKVIDYERYDTLKPAPFNTPENIEALNRSLQFDLDGIKVDITKPELVASSYRKSLQKIAGPSNVKVDVQIKDPVYDNGKITGGTVEVLVDGNVIPNGINNPTDVLNAIQNATSQGKPKGY